MLNPKKKPEEHEEGAAWLATYSDMVTLLFAFFVLMFAISNVDAQKFAMIAAALSKDGITAEKLIEINKEFGMEGPGITDFEDPSFVGPGEEDPENPNPSEENPNEENPSEESTDKKGEDEIGKGDRPVDKLYTLILQYIETNELQTSIAVTYNDDKILLVLANDVWFVSGSANITATMNENVAILAKLLSETQNEDDPFDIIIAGHTDNVPMNTAQYPSNWDLSMGRATNFLKLLLRESGLNPKYFSARGYGEEAPIADNETPDGKPDPEGQQKNRRVEVMIAQAAK